MAKTSIAKSEAGIAHIGMILLVVVVLGVTAFSAYRVLNSNDNEVANNESTSQIESESNEDSNEQQDDGESEAATAKEASNDLEAENNE